MNNINMMNFPNNNFPNILNFPTMPNMSNVPNYQNMNNNQNMSSIPSYSTMALIKNEFDNLYTNPISQFGLSIGLLHDNDYSKWRITLTGARDSSYEGGIYKIIISFPNNYLNAPPLIYFATPIYHLNINPYTDERARQDPLGFVPIERLKIWKQDYSMKEVLTYLYGLFYYVDLDNGYGEGRKDEYKYNQATYHEKVKYFVKKYASSANFSLDWGNMGWNFEIYNHNI
jgi:ubiquitin-protein ligase